MFNRKLKEEMEYLRQRIKYLEGKQTDQYWELRNDFERLLETLHLVKETKNTVEYVRKGGPER